jgi:hypothetical protein
MTRALEHVLGCGGQFGPFCVRNQPQRGQGVLIRQGYAVAEGRERIVRHV